MFPSARRPALAALTIAASVAAAVGVGASAFVPAAPDVVQALDLPPRDYATWHEYATPTAAGSPGAVVVDAADSVWYVDDANNQIVKVPSVAPASHVVYDLGASRPSITALLPAPDGTVWFSDSGNAALGRLDPVTGSVSSFPLGGMFDWAASPVIGADGAIWFGWAAAGGLGRMALDGTLTSVAEPRGGQAYHLVSAEDGRIWYTVDGYGSLGAYDPATGVFDDYFIDVSNFSGLAAGRDGDLWVAGTNLLKKVSLTGAVLDAISIPAASFEYLQPASLVAGVDTELYFVLDEHHIGWIDHAGTLRTSRPPYTGVSLARLSITSYNSVWYTDRGRGTLGNV